MDHWENRERLEAEFHAKVKEIGVTYFGLKLKPNGDWNFGMNNTKQPISKKKTTKE